MRIKFKSVTRRSLLVYSVASLFLSFFGSCSSKKSADLIVTNAVVYTVDSKFSVAESFAVKDGKFIAVGTSKDIMEQYEARETIDAKGKAVYPGIIDSHCHFYGYGQGLTQVNLVGTKSFAEVLQRVSEYAATRTSNKDSWIIGRGWDQNDWENKSYPDLRALDSLFPETPVLLDRIDGHAALANSAALALANINVSTTIEGGAIEKIPAGKGLIIGSEDKLKTYRLSGILVDNAVDLIKKAIPRPTKDQIRLSLLAAQKNCFEVGITTVDDAGLEKIIIDVMDELHKSSELKMRVYAMLSDNPENISYYLNKRGKIKTDRLNVRSFKFYADGALGSRGACLLEPYSDVKEQQGFLLSKKQHFDSLAHLAMLRGFQANTHCIGDSAVRMILQIAAENISRRKLIEGPAFDPSQMRWRIEHLQVSTAGDINFLKGKGIIPSVQPTHATSDMYWAEERLGPERVKYAYAYNDQLKAAGIVALGTDFPVESINPLYTFYAAVARKDLKGYPEGGFQMENALSRENTLRGMTSWGAYANFEESEKGSIENNKFADFIILDNDIMKCEIDLVPKVKVDATFVNGECVYKRQ